MKTNKLKIVTLDDINLLRGVERSEAKRRYLCWLNKQREIDKLNLKKLEIKISNFKAKLKKNNRCIDCNTLISIYSKRCINCYYLFLKNKK